MKKLEAISRRLDAPLQATSNILLIVILVLIFVEVISRYIFGESHGFMEDFSKWAQVWLGYLMLGVITKGRRHIAIDFLPRKLPERYKRVLFLIFDTTILVFAIILCWAGIKSIIALMDLGLVSQTEIAVPLWIIRLCIPLGTMFLAFFAIHLMATDIASLSKHVRDKE